MTISNIQGKRVGQNQVATVLSRLQETWGMDREFIKKLARNPNFIPGIYNYCDRWCERCSFTSLCLNFALSERQFTDPDTRNVNSDIFWQKLGEMFQVTLDMVEETAEYHGIDLGSVDDEKDILRRRIDKENARNHSCSRGAKAYVEMVEKWFDSAKGLFEQKEDELNMKERLSIRDVDPSEEAASLADAAEVIRWYQHLIHVKLVRAIHGSLEQGSEMQDELPNDSDGSAKVALIAVDRSIAAWGVMYKHYPEQEDRILNILLHLERLRRKTEESFPNARSLVRPGFDTR